MKNKFFKTLAVFGLSLIAWNCSEDLASTLQTGTEATITPKPAFEVDQSCWMLPAGTQTFLIVPNGTNTYLVTNENSIPVGTFDVATNTIVNAGGNVIVANVNLATLSIVNPDKTISNPDGSKTTITGQTILLPGGIDPSTVPVTVSSSSVNVIVSSSSAYIPGPTPVASSSSAKTTNPVASSSSQKVDPPKPASSSSQTAVVGKVTVSGNLTQTVSKGASISKVTFSGVESEPQRNWILHFLQANYDKNAKTYTLEGSVPDYWDQATATEEITIDGQKFSFVLTVSGTQAKSSSSTAKSSSSKAKSSSSQQQPKSSSSQPKSSSSAPKSSSSVKSSSSQTQSNPDASAEEAQYLNAGAGGQQGFATRYWDCCMPHCSWPEHGGSAKTCDAKGKTPIGNTNGSICSGGQGTTCTSQIPIIVSDKLAYAFAATPGNDNTCGKCFALTFTGTGKYETKANHQALKGKTLVVMASNIGYDVQGGQFDIMIPGGGFGAFNGCSQMGWNIPQNTTTYGGLLSDCEKEVGYNGDLLTKRKECLTKKCNSAFASDTQAKEGCLFLATWMEAAGNPNHTYKEVPCPAALTAKY